MLDYGDITDGAMLTSTVNSSGIPIDMEKRTKVLSPKNYTTLTLIKKFGTPQAVDNMEHKYRELRPIPNWTTITVADAAGQTTLEVADYTRIKNDMVLWVIRNGVIKNQCLVQDTSIDATVTVVNFTGTTASGGIANATEVGDLVVIGPEAHAEGEAVPTAYSNISVDKTDYLMQIDRAVKKSDIEACQGHYDTFEKKLGQALALAFVEQKSKVNLAFYLGTETKDTTTGDGTRYAINGLWNRLTENIEDFTDVGSGFTLQALQEALRECVDEAPGGGKKVLVAGVNVNSHISSWPQGSVRTKPGSEKWGIMVNTILTQYGEIDVTYDNVLSARFGMADRGAILDSANCRQLYLRNKPMKAYYNITANRDIHNMEHAISGTAGLQTSAVESMASIKGVS